MVATHDTLPPASDEPRVCDVDGCTDIATLSYRWAWGAVGLCCSTHATTLQQTATTLKRSLVVHPIAEAAPAPLLRDERVQLVARALVLEDEVRAHEATCSTQHRKIGDLQLQLNAALSKSRECEAQSRDAMAKTQSAEETAYRLMEENGRLLAELERLRELEAVVAERTGERGLSGETRVDG